MYREDFYKKYEDNTKVDKIIKDFHDLYYESSCIGGTWKNTNLCGSSVDEAVIKFIEPRVKDKKVFIILDSDHSKEHVLKELEIYSKFVSLNSYIVVEDTNTSGPLGAVFAFIEKTKNFTIDRSCEKFYLTFAPYGFLKRVV